MGEQHRKLKNKSTRKSTGFDDCAEGLIASPEAFKV